LINLKGKQMAFITIRNGRVSFANAKGFTLVEEYKTRDGDIREKKFKIWTEEPVKENEILTVSGVFSAKVAEYNGVQYVEVSVNNAKIDRGVGHGTQLQQKQTFDALDDAPF
jgi:hypothetical protein